MATIIDGSGSATFATPLLPAQGGTGVNSFPAFSAYSTANQSPASAVNTKVVLNAKEFDTANAFDAVTNYRFQPLVAGYYQVNFSVFFGNSTGLARAIPSVFKNGLEIKRGADTATGFSGIGSSVVFLNGSTDYIELFAYISATTTNILSGMSYTFFQAYLVRAA